MLGWPMQLQVQIVDSKSGRQKQRHQGRIASQQTRGKFS